MPRVASNHRMRNRLDFESGSRAKSPRHRGFSAAPNNQDSDPEVPALAWCLLTKKSDLLSYEAQDPLQRFVELLRVAAARLCQVGTPTAGAADDRCDLLDDIAGL